MPENKFPTISDMRDQLSHLVEMGYGDLPVQILVAPDSTMQILAKDMGGAAGGRPALMIDFGSRGGRLPVSIISTERLSGPGMPSRKTQ